MILTQIRFILDFSQSLTFQLASSFSSIRVPSGRENQWSLMVFTG